MMFLCPCDRNFAIEDNEWLSSVGSDDKSRGRRSMWKCRVSIGWSDVLQTQQGSVCTTCAHGVLQHYAKDILPPVKLCLRNLKKPARTEPVVCKRVVYSRVQLT